MRIHSPRGMFAVVSLFAVLAGAAFVKAQEFRASIIGQVIDPSGGPIPQATVTAVQHGTNQAFTAKTNNAGVYSIDFVQPGQYTVTVEAQGLARKSIPTSLWSPRKN